MCRQMRFTWNGFSLPLKIGPFLAGILHPTGEVYRKAGIAGKFGSYGALNKN